MHHSSINLLQTGPSDGSHVLILAHGAGAPMDSDFMNDIAGRLADTGIRCVRFEFPYMDSRRQDGKKRPPDRQPVLLDRFQQVIGTVAATCTPGAKLYIGGKSMGGRMATLLAAVQSEESAFHGIVCLGYPFHPPGKPEKTRVDHFPAIPCPVLICQGDRDPFGTKPEIEAYSLPAHVHVHCLPDGNHDLTPRKRSGITQDENLAAAAEIISRFLQQITTC